MTECRIITGDARDIAAIMPIMDSAFAPEFGEAWTSAQCLSLLALPQTSLLIAEQGQKAVGFALTRWVCDEEELLMIGVAPERQRSGIAKALVKHIIARAQQSRRNRIFLEVRANNSALHFYRSRGFENCGIRKSYYKGVDGGRYDAITMALNL
jgi:[ribosomal protein S18]-alanine N-acetyltransferase